MRVLVLGAAGGTGRHVVRAALATGFQATAFVRNAATYEQPPEGRVEVVEGDAGDARALRRALSAHDAVICTVGPAPSRSANVETCTRVTRSLVAAMAEASVSRLVVQTAFGSGESKDWSVSARLTRAVMPGIMLDKDRQEAIVRASDLDWTIVRPPTLTERAPTGRWRLEERASFRPWDRIPRADVAALMVALLVDDGAHGKAFVVRA